MKKIILIFCIILAVCISAATLELLTRFFLPAHNPSGMIEFSYNKDGVLLGAKNYSGRQWKNTGDYDVAVRLNQYGFRDKKDLARSAEGDIFVAGDSFGFGWGVEEEKRYSNLLEKMLRVPVYNISCASAGIDDYGKLIKYAVEHGAAVKNVIISVCMENDLKNYSAPTPIANCRKKRGYSSLEKWLIKHSALYHAFKAVIHRNRMLKAAAIKSGVIIDNYDGMYKNTYSEEAIASSAKRLLELAKDFNTTVVIIPSRGLWVGNNQGVERRIHEKFVKSLKAGGANAIDLRPVFEKGGNPLQYHFKDDGHWNEDGHLKAALAIYSNFQNK